MKSRGIIIVSATTVSSEGRETSTQIDGKKTSVTIKSFVFQNLSRFKVDAIARTIRTTIQVIAAAVLALGLNAGAYNSEAIRAGLLAVPQGQTEAARALGLSRSHVFLDVVMPQAFKMALPPLVSNFVALLKDSSLGYIVGLEELVRRQRTLAEFYGFSQYGFSFFVVTLAAFLIVNLSLSWIARRVSARSPGGRGPRRAARAAIGENADTTLIRLDPTRTGESGRGS